MNCEAALLKTNPLCSFENRCTNQFALDFNYLFLY
jgi:hypothetical protein